MASLNSDNNVDILVKSSADNKGIESASNSVNGLQKSVESATSSSKIVAGAMVGVGVAVAGLGAVAISSAGDFEQYRTAFTVMLGSADKARQMMTDISKFAQETPFELPQVVEASKQLLAFGFAQGEIIPTMRKLGDIAAGVGVPVGQLAYVYGQVRVAGKLMGGDLMQFTNAGVPMIEGLSKVLKVSQADVKDMVSQGKVGFKEVQQVMDSMTGAGSKFGGMMDKQSHTLQGIWSNIQDGFGQTLRSLIGITSAGDIIQGGLFDKIKAGAEQLMPIVQNLPAILSDGFKKLQPYIPVISGAIMGALVPALMAAAGAVWAFLAPLLPFIAAGAAVVLVANTIAKAMGGWGVVMKDLQGAFNAGLAVIRPSMDALWTNIKTNLIPAFTQLWNTIAPVLIPVLKTLAGIIGANLVASIQFGIGAINAIVSVLSFLARGADAVVKGLEGGWHAIASGLDWLKNHWAEALGFMLGFFISLPIKLPFLMGSAIVAVLNLIGGINWGGVWSAITRTFGGAMDGIKNAFIGAYNYMKGINWGNLMTGIGRGVGNAIIDLVQGAINGAFAGIPGHPSIHLPHFAKGVDNFRGGMAIVGEEGPEAVFLPAGSSVKTAGETARMTGNTSVNIGTVILGTPAAADRFFTQLDQDTMNLGKGLTAARGMA